MPRPSDFAEYIAASADNPAIPARFRDWFRELAKDVTEINGGITVTKDQARALTAFANMGVASSRWEALGHTAGPNIDATIVALTDAGLLVALPYSVTHDDFGGTRFKVSQIGMSALAGFDSRPAG